ncbi:MAG: DUF4142 domain-containing protein [Caulobacteraceae bacterium]|nr:DUF4142 domain-containing protein [Caulobacter sp.]
MKIALPLLAAAAASVAFAAHAQPAPDFVRMAAASDKFEITEAKLAETRTHNPRILHAAQMMVRDHTKSTNMIKAAVRQSTGHDPAPPVLNPDQMRMVADLRRTPARDFDRTYVDQQVQSHQQALDLMHGYADHGDNPALKSTAAQITPVVQQHLDMWKDLQAHMH